MAAKHAVLDTERYLSGAGSSLELLTQLRSGFASLDPSAVHMAFRKELTVPTASRPRYLEFAAEVSRWLAEDFDQKLGRLSQNMPPSVLLITTLRGSYDRNAVKVCQIQDMRMKLPAVVKKIQEGDLARFVNLVTASHRYGFCMRCGVTPMFSMLTPSRSIAPMWTVYSIPENDEVATARLAQMEYNASYRPVVGFCSNNQCRPACLTCNTEIPARYDQAEFMAHMDDHMCRRCAATQLINVKRPSFSRLEQRRLRRLIIN